VSPTIWTLVLLLLAATPAAGEERVKGAPRTLDEITIEGEVLLPQVLFVSVEEAARIESAFASLFVPSALDVGLRMHCPTMIYAIHGLSSATHPR
jgi:hypothetical protein